MSGREAQLDDQGTESDGRPASQTEADSEDQQKQIEAVLQDTSLSEDAKKTKKAEIKGATNTQIKVLLDATQQEKFASLSQQPAKEAAAK
jgi:hypothetical protein